MYVLLIIILVGGTHVVQPIAIYPNAEDTCDSVVSCFKVCKSELKRVEEGMKQSYIGDKDFYLMCKPINKPVKGV